MLKDYVAFYWDKMDAWYEEDEEIFVHPRDPYKRVDVLARSRHDRVMVAGETVADTRKPRLLFETLLPVHYCIPHEDVRMDLFVPSNKRTRCSYKGKAVYWSVKEKGQTVKDIVWSYLEPIPECPKIRGMFCFFNERADAIYVDGEKMPTPDTIWS